MVSYLSAVVSALIGPDHRILGCLIPAGVRIGAWVQAVMTDGAMGDAINMADPPKIRVIVRTRPLGSKVWL